MPQNIGYVSMIDVVAVNSPWTHNKPHKLIFMCDNAADMERVLHKAKSMSNMRYVYASSKKPRGYVHTKVSRGYNKYETGQYFVHVIDKFNGSFKEWFTWWKTC